MSTATVSRVVHGHDRVRETTRARVLQVIESLGYVPDSAAQSLSRRRKEIIGLVSLERLSAQFDIESISLLFSDEILHGVEATLREKGWSLLITFLHSGEKAYSRLTSLSGKVDGLLIAEGIVGSAELARLSKRVPLVVIAGARDERAVDVVAVDNSSGVAALVTHLIGEHGRRRLSCVAGPASAPDARERHRALEEIVAAHPQVVSVGVYEGTFSAESGHAAASALLAARPAPMPDAIVCANDQMAIGAIRALTAAGVRVP